MTDEPYQSGKIPDHWSDSTVTTVEGRMVAISGLRLHSRQTELMFPRTRSFPKHSIVEITMTDEEDAMPGKTIDSVMYLGFFKTTIGGIIYVGEPVKLAGEEIGKVVGFSDIHEPNHLNILVLGKKQKTDTYMAESKNSEMVEVGFNLDDKIVFG